MSLSFLDLFFPKRCVGCGRFGSYFCADCKAKIEIAQDQACLVCQHVAYLGKTHPRCQGKYTIDGSVAVFLLSGPIREAVHMIKYRQNFDLVGDLVDLFLENFWHINTNFPKEAILVPVPLHPRRLNWRGFNQAELIAKDLAKKLELDTEINFLKRVKDTRPQVELKGKDRQRNVFRAFAVVDKNQVKGKDFILVDDMRTTGATLKNCANVLKRAGAASVWGLTIARTAPKLS